MYNTCEKSFPVQSLKLRREKMAQIVSKDEFIAVYRNGGVFYWIDCLRGGQPTVVRESTVLKIYYNLKIYPNVSDRYIEAGKNTRVETAVGDLLSPLRGVFTTRDEAQTALSQRKAEFKKNPDLRTQFITEAEDRASHVRVRDDLACAAV